MEIGQTARMLVTEQKVKYQEAADIAANPGMADAVAKAAGVQTARGDSVQISDEARKQYEKEQGAEGEGTEEGQEGPIAAGGSAAEASNATQELLTRLKKMLADAKKRLEEAQQEMNEAMNKISGEGEGEAARMAAQAEAQAAQMKVNAAQTEVTEISSQIVELMKEQEA